jgi:hypothetical protein
VTAAAAAGGVEAARAYERAIRHGWHNTGCSAEEEAGYGTLRLLTLAFLRLPDLALHAQLLHALGEHEEPDEDGAVVPLAIVRAVADLAAGAMRLAHRALETHAASVGYEIDAWLARIVERAGEVLGAVAAERDAVPVMVEQARRATLALTRATAGTARDRMLVPEQVAAGQAHLLVVYLIADEAAR